MEAMALNFSHNMAKALLPKLGAFLTQEAGLLAGVDDDMRYIIDELDSIASFLWGLSEMQLHDKQVKTWMKQVKELGYDAEDCLDEFIHRYGRPHEHEGLKGFFILTGRQLRCLFRSHSLATDLKKLKQQADYVSNRRSRYVLAGAAPAGANSGSSSATSEECDRLSSLFIEEEKLVDIHERSAELVNWMKADQAKLGVFSIVGYGGLGKTTVAKHVIERLASTGSHFHCKAWITVSRSFRIEDLLQQLLKELCKNSLPPAEKGVEKLVGAIQEHLKDKRYVIVVDDLWTLSAWDTIKLAFPDNQKGSRIIITTRDMLVAENCHSPGGHCCIYDLPLLSEHHSRELLCKRVFQGPEHSCPSYLTVEFESILKKCGRLPLAIVTLGGLLATKPLDSNEWKKFLDRIGPHLDTDRSLERMKRVLTLGYNDLPYSLKPCLLYASIFPEDYEIRCKRLVRLWMAEGFVSRRRGMSSEEVADEYLNELINRSLIQRSKIGDDGRVKTCRAHDMMLEVLISISKEENFVTLFGEHFIETPQGKVRRMSVHDSSTLEVDPNISHVRSLTLFLRVAKLLDYRKMALLRVLDLEGCKDICNKDLKYISELFLLKYLSLRGTSVSQLPESIGKLLELETLDIRETNVNSLPRKVVKLQKLAYLLAGNKDCDRRGSQFAVSSTSLYLPEGIGSMKALQVLGTVNCNSSVLEELGELTQLRKLILSGPMSESAKQQLRISLQKLSQSLHSLSIHSVIIDYLDDLSPEPKSLQTLKLCGNLGKLPNWVSSLGGVTRISLAETGLKDDPIPLLRNLSKLVELVIGWQAYEGDEMTFNEEGFLSLKMLYLDDIAASFEEKALPKLELLVIKKYNEGSSSVISGIKHLSNLKKVDIDIFNFKTKYSLITAAEEHPNHPKLVVR